MRQWRQRLHHLKPAALPVRAREELADELKGKQGLGTGGAGAPARMMEEAAKEEHTTNLAMAIPAMKANRIQGPGGIPKKGYLTAVCTLAPCRAGGRDSRWTMSKEPISMS